MAVFGDSNDKKKLSTIWYFDGEFYWKKDLVVNYFVPFAPDVLYNPGHVVLSERSAILLIRTHSGPTTKVSM